MIFCHGKFPRFGMLLATKKKDLLMHTMAAGPKIFGGQTCKG